MWAPWDLSLIFPDLGRRTEARAQATPHAMPLRAPDRIYFEPASTAPRSATPDAAQTVPALIGPPKEIVNRQSFRDGVLLSEKKSEAPAGPQAPEPKAAPGTGSFQSTAAQVAADTDLKQLAQDVYERVRELIDRDKERNGWS